MGPTIIWNGSHLGATTRTEVIEASLKTLQTQQRHYSSDGEPEIIIDQRVLDESGAADVMASEFNAVANELCEIDQNHER
jgi:hypothetical protein